MRLRSTPDPVPAGRSVTRGPTPPLAAVVLAAVVLAGCTAPGGSDDRRGIVSVGIGEPAHLLPANLRDTDGAQVLGALFSPLVRIGADGQPAPLAAESVTSRDNLVWTVRLRTGYTFHDGEAVTADHYLAAWNYAAYGPHRQSRAHLFSNIAGYAGLQEQDPDGAGQRPPVPPVARELAGLRRVDDRTLTVRLLQPFSQFPALLANAAFYPLPTAAWRAPGDLRPEFEQAPIGNGPFRMSGRWQHDESIELRRYDRHPGPRAGVAGVQFRSYARPDAAYRDLVGGRLDVLTSIPAPRLADAAGRSGGRLHRSAGTSVQFLVFPTGEAAFGDARVRRAVSMAIDRDALVRLVPGQDPARSFVAPGVPGYRPDGCGAACVFDPAEARRLYRDAGGPARLELAYNADGAHRDWIDATCRQLAVNLGVRCAGVTRPTFAELLAGVQRQQVTGLFRMSWDRDYPSMESYLAPLFSSTGAANYGGYRNADFDELIRRGAAARTPQAALGFYRQAEDVLAGDLPAIPLRYGGPTVGWSADVGAVATRHDGTLDVAALTTTG